MAVIKPSNKFQGSELNLNGSSASYIRDDVKRAIFNKTTNTAGHFLLFLPAYKLDDDDQGVWYKRIIIRDNFGDKWKEKYYVADRADDPVEYFANHFRQFFPEEAKITETDVNGKKYKKYPLFGRITERVIYNVAFFQKEHMGVHVLDLPLRNGADSLMLWLESKDLVGNPRPPINDPDHCLPVFVRLRESGTNPWMLQVENSNPQQLPITLSDSSALYNLDDIYVHKSKDELISKLRDLYPADVFDACMDGYKYLMKNAVQGAMLPARAEAPTVIPAARPVAATSFAAPEPSRPVVGLPVTHLAAPTTAVNPPAPANIDGLPRPSLSGTGSGRLSKEDAMRFMSED